MYMYMLREGKKKSQISESKILANSMASKNEDEAGSLKPLSLHPLCVYVYVCMYNLYLCFFLCLYLPFGIIVVSFYVCTCTYY